jgi:hypothetical protein
MKRKIIRAVYILLIVIGSLWVRRSSGSSKPSEQVTAPCSVLVPSNTGEQDGVGVSGMDFKRRAALRVIDQLACGPKSARNNYSAINRK